MPYRLGKAPAKKDRRSIRMRNILKVLPPIPDSHDVDDPLGGIVDNNPYNNLTFGDCVIACRAHHTLRLEKFEQGQLITIPDQAVTDEYFKETGGPDVGLVMLESMNAWRQGWMVNGKQYKIHAFGVVDEQDLEEIKATMFVFRGLETGFALPLSAQDQINSGQAWDVVTGPRGAPGTWGGHAIYIKRYEKAITKVNFTCVTWGKQQEMTEDFLKAYCDEGYGIIDSLDPWVDPANDPLDVAKLEQYLHDILGDQPLHITSLSLPSGTVGVPYTGYLSADGGKPPYTWSIYSGYLPGGLTLDPSTGAISGTPVATGTTPAIFLCTDSAGYSTGVGLAIVINAPAPPPVPTPSPCGFGKAIARTLNVGSHILGRKGRFHYLNPPNK